MKPIIKRTVIILSTIALTVNLFMLLYNDNVEVNRSFIYFFLSVNLLFFLIIAIISLINFKKYSTDRLVSEDETTKQDIKKDCMNETNTDQRSREKDFLNGISVQVDKFISLVNKKKSPGNYFEMIINLLAKELKASQGAFYVLSNASTRYTGGNKRNNGKKIFKFKGGYAYYSSGNKHTEFQLGEGLVGTVAKEGNIININNIPDNYITVVSGLGKSTPHHLIICPVKHEKEVVGVMEIASFKEFSKEDEKYLEIVSVEIGKGIAKQICMTA